MEKTAYEKNVSFLRRKISAHPSLKSLPEDLREAEIFSRILREIPIHRFSPEEQLAGEYGALPEDRRFDLPPVPAGTPEEDSERFHRLGCDCAVTLNHTTLDYERLLKKGLRGILEETDSPAWKKALSGVCDFAGRYADELGFEQCRRVPALPARTFPEALQSIFLVNSLDGIAEHSYASTSFGRFDQYLYPFYREAVRKGISEKEIKNLLREFFRKLNRYGDGAGAVNLGGVDTSGKDLFNDFSRISVDVLKELHLPAPLIALHFHKGMREEDFSRLTSPELFKIGQPSFYGEENVRRTLTKRGVPPEELDRWCVNSCMGLMVGGLEFSDMWAVVFNALPGLEAALNHGRAFRPFELSVETPERYESIEEIADVMFRYDRELLKLLIDRHSAMNHSFRVPSPFTSALLSGGIPGKDRLHGGVKYHTANVDLFAVANAADSLTAIDELVFHRKCCTLEKLVEAVKNNWKGQEKLRHEVLACPKFGNGESSPDSWVRRISDRLADFILAFNRGRAIFYMPSFHTLNTHVARGRYYPASPDGRLAGDPFAKNIGPTPGRNFEGISALMRSAAAVDQSRFCGGQALDVYLDRALYETPEALSKLRTAIRTYFQMGGLQLQVNAVDIRELEAALKHPEQYENLTVRIGGYSRRFNTLNDAEKRELIERFKHQS